MFTPQIKEREAFFGEKVCGMSDLLFQRGELYVGEERLSEKGKKYQPVQLTFTDLKGMLCIVRRIFYEGQVYHAETEFKPYSGQIVRLGLLHLNTKKVEVDIGLDGHSPVYTYSVRDIFLDATPPQIVALLTHDHSPRWDADLPDDVLAGF